MSIENSPGRNFDECFGAFVPEACFKNGFWCDRGKIIEEKETTGSDGMTIRIPPRQELVLTFHHQRFVVGFAEESNDREPVYVVAYNPMYLAQVNGLDQLDGKMMILAVAARNRLIRQMQRNSSILVTLHRFYNF